jgi:sulfide:quinone oxidoreductase
MGSDAGEQDDATASSFKVLIVGGGVAALETVLALRELAGARVALTLLAPEADFVYRAMSVGEPFGYEPAQHYPLTKIASDLDCELVVDRFDWVDWQGHLAHTEAGAEIPYDALVLGVGAHAHARYEHALTIDDRELDHQLDRLIGDVVGGSVHSLALVMPRHKAWPLPIYEIALMTAARARAAAVALAITVITPEPEPLDVFGRGASHAVSELLRGAGVTVLTSTTVEIPSDGEVVVTPGDLRLSFDRVVALPELLGPAIRGLVAGDDGFIAIDEYCRVRGADGVFAAGDGTDCTIKHGGIAAQQADVVATGIAALAGAAVQAQPFAAEIHALVLTGAAPLYLSAQVTGGEGFRSQVSDSPSWSPPGKVAAKYLAPYLAEREWPDASRA